MKYIKPVFEIAFESIDKKSLSQIDMELKEIKAYNQNELPIWLSNLTVTPSPIVPNALVDRYGFVLPSAKPAHIDIHELGGKIKYIKIFFLFEYFQLFKKKHYTKIINSVVEEKMGLPDTELTNKMRLILDKNSTSYKSDDHDIIIVIANTTVLTKTEFQIHIYDGSMFDILMGTPF